MERRSAHLVICRRCYPHQQTSTPYRGDDLARTVGTEDQTHIRHVLFHRSSESSLGIACQGVGFVDDHHW